jgi:hypothetical protein
VRRRGSSLFVHPGCTNSGLKLLSTTFPKGVCVPRAVSSVRDCRGFVIADYIRLVFAICQVPFCPVRCIRTVRRPRIFQLLFDMSIETKAVFGFVWQKCHLLLPTLILRGGGAFSPRRRGSETKFGPRSRKCRIHACGRPGFLGNHGFEPESGAPCALFRCIREIHECGPLERNSRPMLAPTYPSKL